MFFYKTILTVAKILMDSCRLMKEMNDLKVKVSTVDDGDGILFWSSLKTRVAKVFFDGVFAMLGSSFKCGFIIFDECNSFLFFQAELGGACLVVATECLAACSDFSKALSLEVKKVVLIGDSDVVISCIKNDLNDCPLYFKCFIYDCKDII